MQQTDFRALKKKKNVFSCQRRFGAISVCTPVPALSRRVDVSDRRRCTLLQAAADFQQLAAKTNGKESRRHMAKRLAFSDNLPLRDKRVADWIPNLMSPALISRERARVHETLHSENLRKFLPSPLVWLQRGRERVGKKKETERSLS